MKIDRTVKPAVNNETSRAHQVRQLLDRAAGRSSRTDEDKRAASRPTVRRPPVTPRTYAHSHSKLLLEYRLI